MSGRLAAVAAAATVTILALAVLWPWTALLLEQAPVGAAAASMRGGGALLATTLGWALAVGAAAALLAWPLGRALARSLPRGGGGMLAIATLVPLALPSYLGYWSLWRIVGPGTWLGDLAIRADAVGPLRIGALAIALVAWTTPLAAWAIAVARWRLGDRGARLAAADGLRRSTRLRLAAGEDRRPLAVAAIVAALATLGEAVSFDLALERTYGYELRTIDAAGAPPGALVAAGWPAIAAAATLLVVACLVARGTPFSRQERSASESPRIGALAVAIAAIGIVPGLLLVVGLLSGGDPLGFARLYGRAAAQTLGLAVTTGVLIATLAASIVVLRLASRPGRVVGATAGLAFILSASVPATLAAVALESGWNRPFVGPIVYDGAAIVVLGLLARLGAVGLLVGWIAAAGAAGRGAELLRVDAPRSILAAARAIRPSLAGAAVAAGAIGTALAWSEIGASARLVPPGVQLLATSLLNAVHYQQPETVLAAAGLALLLAVAAATATVLTLVPRSRPLSALALVALLAVGCREGAEGQPEVPVRIAFGTAGYGPGQFLHPRAVAFDATRGRFFVVDKEGRIQRFDAEGRYELEWRTPDTANGRPVGISVHPDGRVFVADTHYYRVLVYDPEGRELERIGAYGTEPGLFVYPTDVAFGPDGRIYVGEYGGNDRIQVFDAEGNHLFGFGRFGGGEGEFSRPQSLVFDGEELLVADSNNHRIQIFDAEGRLLRVAGSSGIEPGRLFYPRGIAPLGDGTAIVCEFGNHRLQRLDLRPGPDFGRSLGVWGGPPGDGEDPRTRRGSARGRLQYPWDVAGVPGRIAVLDSDADRMLIAPLPD